jgi:hypothetical protein
MALETTTYQAVPVEGQRSIAAAESRGAGLEELGRTVMNTGLSFLKEGVKGERTASYSHHMSQAMEEFTNAADKRYSQTVDQNGNATYKSLPGDISNIAAKVKADTLSKIDDPVVADQFNQEFNRFAARQQIEAGKQSRRQQLNYTRDQTKASIAHLTYLASVAPKGQVGFYTNQIDGILNTHQGENAFSPAEIQAMRTNANEDVAMQRTQFQILQPDRFDAKGNPIQGPTFVQKQIKENPQAFGLPAAKLISLDGQAQTQINRNKSQERSTLQAAKLNFDQLGTSINRNMRHGLPIPNSSLDTFLKLGAETGQDTKAQSAIKLASDVGSFSVLPYQERQDELAKMKANPDVDLTRLQAFETADKNINQRNKNDAYGMAQDQGIIHQDPPLDLGGNVQQQLTNRLAKLQIVEQHDDLKNISPLRKAETHHLIETLSTMGANQQAHLLGEVVGGLGSAAPAVFSQMHGLGATMYAYAGGMATTGNTTTAADVLNGMQILKVNPKAVPEKTFDTEYQTEKTSGVSLFGFTTKKVPDFPTETQNVNFKNAVRLTYISMAQHNGKLESDTIDGDLLKKAIAANTNGGVVDYNGTAIIPPVQNMNESEFQTWVNGISDKDITSLGGWAGWPKDKGAAKALQNARLISIGHRQYEVQLKHGGTGLWVPVTNKDGKLFVLDYDKVQQSQQEA